MPSNLNHKQIVFYDGDCAMCNRFVYFTLLKMDPTNGLTFCPQNSDLFIAVKEKINLSIDLNSIVFVNEGQILIESEAVLGILQKLKRPWNYLGLSMKLFPSFLLNFGYKFIAKRRKKFSSSSCPIMPKYWKQYFISGNLPEYSELKTFD